MPKIPEIKSHNDAGNGMLDTITSSLSAYSLLVAVSLNHGIFALIQFESACDDTPIVTNSWLPSALLVAMPFVSVPVMTGSVSINILASEYVTALSKIESHSPK